MKFRAKINTPWCEKGKIYMAHTYAPGKITFSPNDIPFGYQCVDHPEDYPDLFEPVEEKSNKDKWYEAFYLIATKEFYKEENKEKKLSEIKDDILEKIAKVLDDHGHIAHHIYKEVCGEG